MITLFENQTSNGESPVIKLDSDFSKRNNKTAERVIVATGVFGGATVTIEISGNGVDFAPLTNNTFTTAAAKSENLPNELYIKATITGATGTTDINVHVA